MSKQVLAAILISCAIGLTMDSNAAGADGGSVAYGREGSPCHQEDDCHPGLVCGYPTADGCAARGVCLVARRPGMPHCMSLRLQCGCDGRSVSVPCDFPAGFAPAPIAAGGPATCRGPLIRAPVRGSDAGTTLDGR